MPSLAALRDRADELRGVFASFGASNIRVFGSAARGDDTSSSDIDFLVDVERGRTLLDLIELELQLGQALGAKVDVLTEGDLSPYLRERILAEAVDL